MGVYKYRRCRQSLYDRLRIVNFPAFKFSRYILSFRYVRVHMSLHITTNEAKPLRGPLAVLDNIENMVCIWMGISRSPGPTSESMNGHVDRRDR